MSWKKVIGWVLPSVLGIGAGAMSGSLFERRPPAPGRDATVSVQIPTALAPAAADPMAMLRERRVGELEERLRSVEDAQKKPGENGRQRAASSTGPRQDIEREARAAEAEHQRAHLKQIERHSHEAADPSWGKQSERVLQEGLSALSQTHSFGIQNVDCRTTLCTATLEWPNKQAAVESLFAIVANRYDLNCNKEMSLPESSDNASSYRATLVLDCEEFRANGYRNQ